MHKKIISVYIDDDYISILYCEKSILRLIIKYGCTIKISEYNKFEIEDIIKSFILKNKLKPQLIRYVIDSKKIITQIAVLPYMSREYIYKNIMFDMEQSLGLNVERYNIYFKTNVSNKKVVKIKVFAVSKSEIKYYKNLSEKLNLKLDIIEGSHESLERVNKFLYSNNSILKFLKFYYINICKEINIDKYLYNIGILLRR